MQHDQQELDNVSRNVIRDIEDREDSAKLVKLIQRACRYYAEYMEPITTENQRLVRGPLDDIRIDAKEG